MTQQEVAYYFVALVMGLVNGLGIADRPLTVGINVLLLATMLVVDSSRLRDRARRMDVHLDVVHADDAALIADLEQRLGGTVTHHEVNDQHEVRDTGTHVLVESKSGAQGGSVADRVLRELGVHPASVSKYAVGVAALHPELPSNPWHQTLRRYFQPRTAA